MSDNKSACKIFALDKKNPTVSKYGTQPIDATFPAISHDKSTSTESSNAIEFNPCQEEGSVSEQDTTITTAEAASVNQIATSHQLQEDLGVSNNKKVTDNKELNRSDTQWQHLAVLLKFFDQQLTTQLPSFFSGILAFIFGVILISQGSEGIKVKLDLEVSPKSSQVERNFIDKK